MKIFQRNIHYANFPVEITVLLHSQRGFFGYLFNRCFSLQTLHSPDTCFTLQLFSHSIVPDLTRSFRRFLGKGCCAKIGIIICNRKHNPICILLSVGISVTDNARKYAVLAPQMVGKGNGEARRGSALLWLKPLFLFPPVISRIFRYAPLQLPTGSALR